MRRPFLAVQAIFSREFDYLPEWIDWHVAQGVRRFYLYQNDPAPLDVTRVAHPKHQAMVRLIDWRPGHVPARYERATKRNGFQKAALTHFVRTHARKARWSISVDIDEFTMSAKTHGTVRDVIRKHFEPRQHEISSVVVRCYDFGPSGFNDPPAEKLNIWNAFQERRTHYPNPGHKMPSWCGKCIINGRFASVPFKVTSVHYVAFKRGRTLQDNGRRLRINHYFSKSVLETTRRAQLWHDNVTNNVKFNAKNNGTRRGDLTAYLKGPFSIDRHAVRVARNLKTKLRVKTYPLSQERL